MIKADNPGSYVGKVVDTGHCVRYVQVAAGAPHTSQWKQGAKVKGSGAPPGTVIATFGFDGRYENRTDGKSHAAILLAERPEGLVVLDQWQGHPVAQRTVRFKGGEGKPVNDGDQFYVVEA